MADHFVLGPEVDTSWHDPGNAHTIQSTSDPQQGTVFNIIVTVFTHHAGRRIRPARANQGTRLAAALAAEKLDEFGNPVKPSRQHPVLPRKPRTVEKRKQSFTDHADTDEDDGNFAASSTDDESDGGDTDIVEIGNEEV